jgi:allophanate hydrolase
VPSAVEAVEQAYARIEADGSPGIFIELVDPNVALRAARAVDAVSPRLPLAGTTLGVKGNIDVAGHRTTAGCPTFGSVAAVSAPVVRALEAAGTVTVAITNLDQFATGLVGTRSPYGICPNAHWPGLISGGSSSGSAVAVARGLVDLALGTDTAGSGRVPAAASGIVGLKPTRGWLSTSGVVPACRSLDCVAVFARDIELGWTALQLAAGNVPDDPFGRVAPRLDVSSGVRVGTGLGSSEFVMDAVEVDVEPFLAAGSLLYDGAFVAERYAAVGAFVDAHRDEVDPTVGAIIAAAGLLPAWQLARDQEELARLRRATEATWERVDVLALPTVPRFPTVADVIADPVGVNAELGMYTTFVNLLDLCALTLPVGPRDEHGPPPSVTLIAPAWHDAALVSLARHVTRDRTASLRSE